MTRRDRFRTFSIYSILTALSFLLLACGGGGGGGGGSNLPGDTQTGGETGGTAATTWTTAHKGVADFYEVLWDGRRYLAVSDGSGLYTSTNGVNWVRMETDGFGGNFSIAYVNGLYLSGGDWQTLYTSTDAINWDSHSLCSTSLGCFSHIYGLAGNAIGYVAAGEDGLLYYSSDGAVWEQQDGLVGTWESFRSAAASPERFVVVGAYNGVIYSDDGKTWTEATFDTQPQHAFGDVLWDGKQFVATGWGFIYASADGINWAYQAAEYIVDLTWTGTYYESLGYRSADLVNWTQQSTSMGYILGLDRNYIDFHYLPETGQYLMLGGGVFAGGGWIASSNDAISWEMVMSSHDMVGATWTGDHFMAVDSTGVLFESVDGKNWNSNKIIQIEGDSISEDYKAIAWSPVHSRYVAISTARTAVSDDGVNWSNATNGGSGHRVKWRNNRFLKTNQYSGEISISSDGLAWDSYPVTTSIRVFGISIGPTNLAFMRR